MATLIQAEKAPDRVLSVDFFRGFTMFMLVTGITNVFHELAHNGMGGSVIAELSRQFEHAEWNGLFAWDLIQPFFMFIVGVAMPFSFAKRTARGDSYKTILMHALSRSFWLLALGFMLGSDRNSHAFQNVLAQLSFTYLVAFLLMRTDFKIQIAVSFGMIILSDVIYRVFPVDGFNQPFTPDKNFGAWVDLLISGHLSTGHWVSFNAIPTTAHTMWGVLTGMLLMKDWTHNKKLLVLLIPGTIMIITGYLMDPYIPIIKRICTSSFVIVSGGYCLVAMAFSYWLIDVMRYTRFLNFFAIVGMNAIFIYLFSNLGGKNLLRGAADPFTSRIFFFMGDVGKDVVVTLVVAAMVWYMCYYLYKKKIFIRL
ncbi:MAG TPA: DUF5009 domain-containing protein [Bacteroidales bacterium]|nr:DUF5009 domain-containing protein [Bacteroidales bacterium]